MRGLVVLSLLVATPALAQESLDVALARELEVLEREKAQLAETLARADAETATAKSAVEADIERLSRRLVELRAANEDTAKTLPEAERLHHAEDQERQLTQIEDRIRAFVEARELSIDDALHPLPARITAALGALRRTTGLTLEDDAEYFDVDGRAQRAPVLRLGEVAAVTWTRPAHPLVRVPGGAWAELQGLAQEPAAVGAATAVELVVFDPREPPSPDRYRRGTILERIREGGFAMWPLLLLGLIGALLSIERSVALLGWQRRGSTFVESPSTASDRHLAALAGIVAEKPADAEERAIDILERLQIRLSRGLSFLALVAAVAPLIGLLGTVTGMIGTFAVITEHGTGDPRLLSGGISEALLTTQLGLTIAVPALLLYTGLDRWAHGIVARIEEAVDERIRAQKAPS